MITHNSFKLIIDEKNAEARRLRNELHNTKLRNEHLERERGIMFNQMFGRPVSHISIKEVGVNYGEVEVRTQGGETLIFEMRIKEVRKECEI